MGPLGSNSSQQVNGGNALKAEGITPQDDGQTGFISLPSLGLNQQGNTKFCHGGGVFLDEGFLAVALPQLLKHLGALSPEIGHPQDHQARDGRTDQHLNEGEAVGGRGRPAKRGHSAGWKTTFTDQRHKTWCRFRCGPANQTQAEWVGSSPLEHRETAGNTPPLRAGFPDRHRLQGHFRVRWGRGP